LARLRERKEKALADRVQIQAQILSGDLVLCNTVTLAIGSIYATYRTQFLCIDTSLGDTIAAIFNMPDNVHTVRKIMSDMSYAAMRKQKEGLEAFIKG